MRHALTLLLIFFAAPLRAEPLVVFAAASLKGPLDRVAAEFGEVTVAYGGSGALARQVARGAPADVVILAHPQWMDWLAGQDALSGAPRDILSNRLVLVAKEPGEVALTPAALDAALGSGRLALGRTDSVPSGLYARQALTALGLWEGIADRLAEVENVRVAGAYVRRGVTPLAVVYASDAATDDGLVIVATFPAEAHDPIRYLAAVTAPATHPRRQVFLRYLLTDEAQAGFGAAGFLPPVAQ